MPLIISCPTELKPPPASPYVGNEEKCSPTKFPDTWEARKTLHEEAKSYMPHIKKYNHLGLKNDKEHWWDPRFQLAMSNLRAHKGLDPLPMGVEKLQGVGDLAFKEKYQGTISSFLGFVKVTWGLHEYGLGPFLDGGKLWVWLWCMVAMEVYASDTIGAHMRQTAEIVKHLKGTGGFCGTDLATLEQIITCLQNWCVLYQGKKGVSNLHVSSMEATQPLMGPVVDLGWDCFEDVGHSYNGPLEEGDVEALLQAGDLDYKSGDGRGDSYYFKCLAGVWKKEYGLAPLCHTILLQLVDEYCHRALVALVSHVGQGPIRGDLRELLRVAFILCLLYGYFPVIRIGALLEVMVGYDVNGGNCMYVHGGRVHLHTPHSKRTAKCVRGDRDEQARQVMELEAAGQIVHHSIPLESRGGQVCLTFMQVLMAGGQKHILVDQKGVHMDAKVFSKKFKTMLKGALQVSFGNGPVFKLCHAILPRSCAELRRMYGTLTLVEEKQRVEEWKAQQDDARAKGKRVKLGTGQHLGKEEMRAGMMCTSLFCLKKYYQVYKLRQGSPPWEEMYDECMMLLGPEDGSDMSSD